MSEENELINPSGDNIISDDRAYEELLNKYQDLMKNSVPKAKYEASEARAIKLQDAMLAGINEEKAQVNDEKLPTRNELVTKYMTPNSFANEYEAAKNFVDLADATIREYGKNPLVRGNFGRDIEGNIVEPSEEELAEGDLVLNAIREAIEECEGNPALFKVKFDSKKKLY